MVKQIKYIGSTLPGIKNAVFDVTLKMLRLLSVEGRATDNLTVASTSPVKGIALKTSVKKTGPDKHGANGVIIIILRDNNYDTKVLRIYYCTGRRTRVYEYNINFNYFCHKHLYNFIYKLLNRCKISVLCLNKSNYAFYSERHFFFFDERVLLLVGAFDCSRDTSIYSKNFREFVE